MIHVRVGEQVVRFPEGTPKEVMEKALQEYTQRKQPKENPHSAMDGMSGTEKNLARIGRGMSGMLDTAKLVNAKIGNQLTEKKRANLGGGVLGVSGRDIVAEAQGEPLDDTKPSVSDDQVKQLEDRIKEDARLYQELKGESPLASWFFETVGGMAAAPVPGVSQASLLPRMAGNAAINAGVAGLEMPDEGETRLGNAATAAAFTGALEPIGALVKGAVRKGINAKNGELGNENAQELFELGDQHDVPVHLDDVAGGTAQGISKTFERVPIIGTKKGKEIQGQKAEVAANNLLEKYSQVNPDYTESAQQGLTRKVKNLKRAARHKYDKVGRVADSYGDIPLPTVDRIIDELVEQESKLGASGKQSLVNDLLSMKAENTPRGNFSHTRQIRSILGKRIDDFYKGKNQTLGSREAAKLQQVKNAVEADMESFIKSTGNNGLIKEWRSADKFFQQRLAIPFKETRLKRLTETHEPEQAWKYLVANGGIPSRAKMVYQSLDNNGRNAVKFGLLKEALDSSTNEGRVFSPAKYAKSIEDRMTLVNQFFPESEAAQIKGFAKLMRHIEKAGQVEDNPINGSLMVLPTMMGAAVIDPTLGLATVGSAAGVKELFQNPRLSKLLIAASKENRSTKAMDNIAQTMINTMTRANAVNQ